MSSTVALTDAGVSEGEGGGPQESGGLVEAQAMVDVC